MGRLFSWKSLIDHPLEIVGGHLHLSDRAGLGVDLVEEVLESHPGVTEFREGFYV